MGYKVLALKWRPQNFDQVIGQNHITQALNNAIKFDRVSHAFTFSGPRGVGKTTTARILAQKLNNIEDINSSFDIIEMDAASNRGIDEIRSLRENVSIAPVHGKYKIYIIDEVHMLTKEAFNALLKTLEEPPDRTVFILATTDPHKMPATILSRTQRYDFRRLTINDIKKQLIIILESEKKEFDELGLELIARKADGSMRDALGYLDQVMNYCEDNIDLESIQKTLGVISDDAYLNIFDNICQNNISVVVTLVNETIMQGVSVYDFITGFNAFLRKILHSMIGSDNSHNLINEWLNNNTQIIQIDIIRIMELIFQFELKIRLLDQSDLALELLMVKLCNLGNFSDISDIIKSLDENEDENKNSTTIKERPDSNIENITEAENTENSKQKKSPVEDEKNIGDTKNYSIIEEKLPSGIKKNISEVDNTEDIEASIPVENEGNIEDTKNSTSDLNIDKQGSADNSLDKKKVFSKMLDIVNYIDEKNSKIAALLSDVEIVNITNVDIFIKVNNISNFIYDTLINGADIIKTAFNIILKTNHNIVIEKGSEMQKEDLNNKSKIKDEEHPLFMNFLENFDGEILR